MLSNLVVAGCVEDEAQGPKAGHQLCVDPELVESAQLLVDHSMAHWDKEGQWKVERLQQNLLLLSLKFLKCQKIPRIQMIEKLTVWDLWQGWTPLKNDGSGAGPTEGLPL